MLQFDILKTWLQARTKTDRGASLVEYALLVALIAVVCIVAIGVIGFVGGMDIPIIRKFACGYVQGARHADPDVKVLVNMTGPTPAAPTPSRPTSAARPASTATHRR